MGILFVVVMPFNLSKNLATLRYFSMFILVIVFFTISVSLIQSPSYYETYKGNLEYSITPLAKGFNLKWLQGLATMMLSYNCQITFFYVRGEMRLKTKKRVNKIINYLLSLEFLFYLTIALSGYISLGDKLIPGVYTLRRPLRELFCLKYGLILK